MATAAMLEPAPEGDMLIAHTRTAVVRRLDTRDRLASALLAAGFLIAALALVLAVDSSRAYDPLAIGLLIGAYALATRITFEVGTATRSRCSSCSCRCWRSCRCPPCRFCVLGGLLLGGMPEVIQGKVPLERRLLRFVNSWHAVGPALVLIAAGEPQPTPRHLLVYGAAVAAQFAFDFASTAARDRLGLGVSPLTLLPVMGWIWAVDLALTPVAILVALGSRENTALVLFCLPLIGLLGYFARERKAHIDKALELSNAYRGTALLLGDMVGADDVYTGLHSQDVVSLVLTVAERLELDPGQRRDAEFTALLHDVGKVKVPNEIINKPGALTAEEREIINLHTIDGQRMLEKVGGLLGQIGYLVRSCHERWDGGGYPDGLAGEQIPLVARIVCACDAFSAMTTTRPYRAAMSTEDAIDELLACAGTQFDPDVVAALTQSVNSSRFPNGSAA